MDLLLEREFFQSPFSQRFTSGRFSIDESALRATRAPKRFRNIFADW